ncbi:hypothetical protein CFP56_016139 [Quercus suber]|uniref:Uncharacterized protein n=1 Tax=Quercus suber TaxID=58331 RepID=A0AAW0KPI8_QUESU
MSRVILMLASKSINLPEPSAPPFSVGALLQNIHQLSIEDNGGHKEIQATGDAMRHGSGRHTEPKDEPSGLTPSAKDHSANAP